MTRFLVSFLLVFSAVAAYAADPTYIKDGDTCDNTSTGALSGNIQLETVYSPNVINISWQDEKGTQLSTSTCTYDTQLQIPNAPSARTGYTFKGWVLDETTCAIPGNPGKGGGDIVQFAPDHASIGADGTTNSTGKTAWSVYGLVENGEWAIRWSNGDMFRGTSLCSAWPGDNHDRTWGDPSSDWIKDYAVLITANGKVAAQYCWCQVTTYTATVVEDACSLESPLWVYYGVSNTCRTECADLCASGAATSAFRSALFTGLPVMAQSDKSGDSGGDEKIDEKTK